ncbi:MAG: archaeosortase A [Halobacteriota archaeon]
MRRTMLKIILPFIAIGLFLLALVYHKRAVAAYGWIVFAGYCFFKAYECLIQGDYFYTTVDFVFLALSLMLAFLMVRKPEEANLFFSLTKIALIAALLYFPFAEITILGDSLIHITANIVTKVLNLLNPGSVYLVPPYFIYYSSNHHLYVEIILACTAIESIVLFTGIIFGVNASMRRKLKAFMVSVPVIYGLNIFRNVFVVTAYFEQWFASPRWHLLWLFLFHGSVRQPLAQSFDIAHEVLARMGSMLILIVIAYAVFMILPEALDLIENLSRVISRERKT